MSAVDFSFMAVAAAVTMALIVPAAVSATDDNVIISQVLYNPSGTSSGGEAVELYNPAPFSVNMSGWVLATETSPTDAILSGTAVVCGGCYFLVADSNWSSAKDNASWLNADYEEAMTLANSDAGVALKDSTGATADAVGWGNPASIGSGLFEGFPHVGSSIGNSLIRKKENGSYLDTGNSSKDFANSAPDFRNSSSVAGAAHSSGEIGVTIVVGGSGPAITSLAVLADDDSFLAGSQISPVPGANRAVSFEAVVLDANGISDVVAVVASFNGSVITMQKKAEINLTAAAYSASFNLSSSFPAGAYSIAAVAVDNSGYNSSANASFEYLSLAAVEVDASSVVFFAEPGEAYEIQGDWSAATASNVTLSNNGNVKLDFEVWSTNFTSGNNAIAASRLSYAFDGSFGNLGSSGVMSNAKARKDVNLKPGAQAGLTLRLDMPPAALPGNYSGKISLVAVNS